MPEINSRVHRAFFARFGGRLRPIQEAAFAQLSPHRDALVMAQTGSGKTEAVLAPVAVRLQEGGDSRREGLRALVLSPTKALAGDLHRRMAPVFATVGLRLDVATSDQRTVGATLTDVIIRTPEGVDRDLCYKSDSLRLIEDVVIDELHAFLDGPRGTQLGGLLARLSLIAPNHRRLGISATVADYAAPAGVRLLRDPVVVEDPGETGAVELLYHQWLGSREQAATRLVEWLHEQGVRKAIGFVGRRARAEEVSRLVSRGPFLGKTYSHHADLSTPERRKVEEGLRRVPVGIVVATTTLEVGIDIGSVDTCILFDAPPDRASYMQRIGRAGRRSGIRRVVCVVGLFDRRIDFVRVAEPSLARVSRPDYRPYLAGCLQQVLSFLAGRGSISFGELEQFWATAFGLDEADLHRLVGCLTTDRWLIARSGSVTPGPLLLELQRSNRLHLTFSGSSGTRLIDEATGRSLGFVSGEPGDEVVIGARGRKITGFDLRRGVAVSVPTDDGTAQFAPRGLSIFEQLAIRYAPYFGNRVRIA